MATSQITGSPSSFSLSSSWHCTGSPDSSGYYHSYSTPTVATKDVTFDLSSIPKNATITKAYVYATWGSPAYGFNHRNINGVVAPRDGTTDVTITSDQLSAGSFTATFKFSSATSPQMTTSTKTGVTNVSGVYLYVEYTIPYTACGAPTSCKVAVTITHSATTLSWSGATAGTSNAITGYEVQRCESSDGATWGSWAALSTVTGTSLSVSPPGTYGNYYKYRVRTHGAAGSAYYSGWKESTNTLRRDHAPLDGFTDPTLTAGETAIKAVHMTELQDRVNTLRAFYGLSAYGFSNPEYLADWTKHVTEIRTAVDAIGKSHDAWIAITENRPTKAVMDQLRSVVLAI